MLSPDVLHLESLISASRQTRTGANHIPVTLTSPLNPTPFTLRTGTCIVGSGPGAGYVVSDKTVSRQHVSLQLVPDGVRVIDLGSTNGTAYSGHRVDDAVLSSNGQLRLGRASLQVQFAFSSPTEDDVPTCPEPRAGEMSDMRQLLSQLERLEGSLLGVLLTGESVTGKRLVARTIHERSLVNSGALVTVDCGVHGRDSLRDSLFGPGTGSHIGLGASTCGGGAFVRAEGGTLFLDEVDQLPFDLQTMLMRVLHDRELHTAGALSARRKVRLIAAADRDLEELVQRGMFRRDLHLHLNVARIHVPLAPESRNASTRPLAADEPASVGPRARTRYARG